MRMYIYFFEIISIIILGQETIEIDININIPVLY